MKTKRKKTGGRKKGDPTEVVRIPKELREELNKMVYEYKQRKNKIKNGLIITTIHPMP